MAELIFNFLRNLGYSEWVFFRVLLVFFLCRYAGLIAAPSDNDATSKKEYVDIVLSQKKIGDTIVGTFSQLGLLAEECKVKKLKLRVWAIPPLDMVLNKNPPEHVEVKTLSLSSPIIQSQTDVATFLKAIDYQNTLKSSREVIIPEQSFIFMGENFKNEEENQAGFRRLIQLVAPGEEALFHLSNSSRTHDDYSLNVYDLINEKFKAGINFGAREYRENATSVARHRAEVASWAVVNNSERNVVDSKRLLFQHPERPLVFINFAGARHASDLIATGMGTRVLDAVVQANPDSNFLLADFSNTPLFPIANKSLLTSKEDLNRHIQALKEKGVQIASLKQEDLGSGLVASFLASSQTDFVITNDTGLAHLAAALRQERPNTVHTIHWDSQMDSYKFWSIPDQKSYLIETSLRSMVNNGAALDKVARKLAHNVNCKKRLSP